LNESGRYPSRCGRLPMYFRYRTAWYTRYGDITAKNATMITL
jgi:hypothetical protein